MSSKIWIASELFYPVQTSTGYIMTEIAKELAKDHEVHVICGPAGYGNEDKADENKLNENIVIHRISSFGLNKDKLVSRTFRVFLLSLSITWQLITKARAKEKVFTVTNPALLILMIRLAGRLKKFDVRILVHDVFPENMVAAGLITKKNLLYRLLQNLFSNAFCNARQVLVLGRDMKQLFLNKGVKAEQISITENWADTDSIVPQAKTKTDSGLVIQFAGNMGRVQGLLEFAGVYKKAACTNVAVHMIGSGAVRDALLQYKKAENLQLLRILPPFQRSEQSSILNACDVALVCLAKGMYGLGVPSKVYNILAAGKPILYIGHPQSEVALMIGDLDIGWQFDDFNEALVSFLQLLDQTMPAHEIAAKGANARRAAEKYYSKELILLKYKRAIV